MRNLGTNLTNTWAALGFGIVWSAIFFSWKKFQTCVNDCRTAYWSTAKFYFWGKTGWNITSALNLLNRSSKRRDRSWNKEQKHAKILMKLNETFFFLMVVYFSFCGHGTSKNSQSTAGSNSWHPSAVSNCAKKRLVENKIIYSRVMCDTFPAYF